MRIDLLLVEKGLAQSRARAQALIESGKVFLVLATGPVPVTKASQKVDPSGELLVEADAMSFVSRGGLKMQGALERTRFDVHGKSVLDVGISTGGFTDCLLQAGAASVVGVDVGHGQLAAKLAVDPRVTLLEGVNARDLSRAKLIELNKGCGFDLIVADVSFISLTIVLPELVSHLGDQAALIALVKPQFEVGPAGLGKNGIVKSSASFADVETKIRKACVAQGLCVEDYFASPIDGSDGNREFFVYARAPQLALGDVGHSAGSERGHRGLPNR